MGRASHYLNGFPRLFAAARGLHRHSRSSGAELEAFRDRRLRRLLLHAYERVPYYRKLFDRHRLHPRHIRGVRDLDLIPITSKQDLRDLRDGEVLASGFDAARLLTARTSGSSGEPFTIRRSWAEDKLQHLFALRALDSLGLRPRDRRAEVALRRTPNPRDQKLIGRTLRGLGVYCALPIDGLGDPSETAALLRRFRPDVITGMPGMLCRVADHLLASEGDGIRPRFLVVGGEVLTPVMRRRLAEAFAAPVRQTYASHEFPLLGWECTESGALHTNDDGVIVEVLRDGRPAEPGEPGEVVGTHLHAYAMPFIRYRLGDVVTRGQERCACGQPFSSIGSIQGRVLDCFSLPGGRVLHPYEILTRLMPGAEGWIRQYQLDQERPDRIVLRVIPVGGPVAHHVTRIERLLGPLLGPGVEFQVQLLDQIPLEPSGKFRAVRPLARAEPGPVTPSARG